jgi:integrase
MYRDTSGRQRKRSSKIEHSPDAATPKERAALAAANKRNAQLLANEIEGAERGDPTEGHLRKLFAVLSERICGVRVEAPSTRNFFKQWIEQRNLAPSTVARYRKPLEDFLEHLGNRADGPIDRVTGGDIDAYTAARLKDGFSAVTVRTDRKALNGPFAAAVRQGIVQINPVAKAEPIEATSEAKEPFSRVEVEALIKCAAGTEWETLIHLCAFTGARLGDAVKFSWECVDLDTGTISFRPQKTQRKKRDLALPLAPRLQAYLAGLPKPHRGPLCPTLARTRIGGSAGLSLQFQALMEKVGIDSGTIAGTGKGRAFNRKTAHSLRHFFISELQRQGIPPDVRMKLAGHASSAVHNLYSHAELETLAKAVARL